MSGIIHDILAFRNVPDADPAVAFKQWFRSAYTEWLETGSTDAFLPFTNPFENPGEPERNVAQFVLQDLVGIGRIGGISATEMLASALSEELAGIARPSSPFVVRLKTQNVISGLAVPTFHLLYDLDRAAALEWFAAMSRGWQTHGHLRTSNRVPLPVHVFTGLREMVPFDGPASAAARAFFDWCLRHPAEPGVAARAVDALCLRLQSIPRADHAAAQMEASEALRGFAPGVDANTNLGSETLAAAACSHLAAWASEGWEHEAHRRILNALGDAAPTDPIYRRIAPESAAPLLGGAPWFKGLIETRVLRIALKPRAAPETKSVSLPTPVEASMLSMDEFIETQFVRGEISQSHATALYRRCPDHLHFGRVVTVD